MFVALPTGYGKSLCHALLPIVFDVLPGKRQSIVVVVSPLTSLVMEQREKFVTQRIPAEFIGELQQEARCGSGLVGMLALWKHIGRCRNVFPSVAGGPQICRYAS